MTVPGLLTLQALTSLSLAPAGPGLPGGWKLQRLKGVPPPSFEVTRAHTLRIGTAAGSGSASYRLRAPLRPRGGTLTWNWRTGTPLRDAALRRRTRDDAPLRVLVVFEDGRTLLYSWGNKESRGEWFLSWTGANRGVIVLERTEDADGSWHRERRDPFADYRVTFNRAPKAVTAVGAGADTDQLRRSAVGEVGELTWEPGARP